MKNLAILFFLFIFALTTFGQTPKTTHKKLPKTAKTVVPKPGSEAEELEKAKAVTAPAERLAALQNFIKNFPASTETAQVQALMVTARVELGIIKLQAKDMAGGIELYKLAVQEAPAPVPDDVFSKILLGLPVSLYALNERAAAFDVAKLIEEKIGANSGQVLELSKFYLNVEYGTEAIRLAQKAVELAPASANAYQTLAAANRLNFRIEDAAAAYAKAVELDAESDPNRLSLAEMKRALGKTDEAIALYREVLARDAASKPAQAGLTLTLFDAGKRAEAEAELKKSLDADPENSRLMTSAAYWYAARGFNEQALEYSRRAIALEPRNVWSYIAQSRALLAQNKPLEAEKILLAARQYSDFPTLDYELASVRFAAGLYREAAETLKRSFTVNKDGALETYLGNRILADAGSFSELLSLERRVALFETKSADNEETNAQLKSLLQFNQKLETKDATAEEIAQAADEFARGADNMRLHRQLFAASRLLQKKTALPKVLELMQAAVGGVDSALSVPSPSASVLADEIYDSRQYAISQNLVVVVPEIPRQTLSAILRGRIEDIAGLAFFQQNDVNQSIVRLKRALSVLPDKSVWSRTSAWHLGEVLQADGKEKEALESFIKGYNKEIPDPEKRAFIENLYVKVNGSTEGLDERVGVKSETTVAATENKPVPTNTDNVKVTEPAPLPETKPEPVRVPVSNETPQAIEVKTEPSPSPKTEETPETKVETKTETKVEPSPEPTLPENKPVVTPEKTIETLPSPTPADTEINKSDLKTEPSPVPPETTKTEEVKSEEVKPEPLPSPTPTETPVTEIKPVPTPETKPEEKPADEIKAEINKQEETKTEETNTEETKPTETKPAPSPTPQNISVIITDNTTNAQVQPKPKAEQSKPENKPAEKTSQNTSKLLFEPVIISVGKNESSTPEKTEAKTAEEKLTEERSSAVKPDEEKPVEVIPKPENQIAEKTAEKPAPEKLKEEKTVEPAKRFEVVLTDTLQPQNKPAEKRPETQSPEKQSDEKFLTGENRPRIIITENTGVKSVTEEISTCKLIVRPDSLSLLNGGGSLGVSVEFEGEGDFRRIRAASGSAEDVEVTLDPEIGANQNRAFFIVKSVSTKTGIFTITFEAPCGKKEILVKVR
jgi:tetratricopeptide (TPR) repeat protein